MSQPIDLTHVAPVGGLLLCGAFCIYRAFRPFHSKQAASPALPEPAPSESTASDALIDELMRRSAEADAQWEEWEPKIITFPTLTDEDFEALVRRAEKTLIHNHPEWIHHVRLELDLRLLLKRL